VIWKYWKMKNTQIKFKSKVKVTGRVKALIAFMLSAVLADFALYSPTTGDNAPRKGRHLPPKTTGVVTQL
jgi:hypothetical protein